MNMRNDRTIEAVRRFHNRTGLYDLNSVDETVRVLGLEKLQMENREAREARERAQRMEEQRRAERLARIAVKEARRAEKEARRQARIVRREARFQRRQARDEARRNMRQEGEGRYTYKAEMGSHTQMGARLYIDGLNILFSSDTLGQLENIIRILLEPLPEGFYYSVRLVGAIYRGNDVEVPRTTIAITRVGNDFNLHMEELSNHKNINLPSERYAIINDISVFYERQQGGSFTSKGYDELREKLAGYKIFCPKTKQDCGKVCLALYKIDAEDGRQPLAYMRSKSPVPVVDCVEDVVDECILLYQEHYFVVKAEAYIKQQRKEKNSATQKAIRATEAYKITNKERQTRRKAHRENSKVMVYDIESENRRMDGCRTTQIPQMISFSTDGVEATTYYGEDCGDRLIKYLLSKDGKMVEYVYAFNGGNYDHILIRNAIISNGLSIKECRRSANSIIRLTALVSGKQKEDGSYTEAREIVFTDLLNFTRGTLRQNFKSYGIAEKGSYDFTKINGSMEAKDVAELRKYCEWDTLGTFQLYVKIRDVFTGLGLDINKLYTLSQGAFKLLKGTWKGGKLDKFRQPKYIDDMGRKASIGGRTEVFKHSFECKDYEEVVSGRKVYEDIADYIKLYDVVSQYPGAMCKNLYPVGDYTHTKEYQEDYLGIYDCVVNKPMDLKHPVVYDKSRCSYNLLKHRGYHTSVDIEQMRKYGYSVKVLSGVYWEESEYVFKEYIDTMFRKKQEAVKDTPEYLMYKTFINAVFGKCLQNDDHVEHFIIKQKEDLVKMYSGRELKKFTMEWEFYEGVETGYYTYTTAGSEKSVTDKLGHIGAFILSYSKVDIYDVLTQTDAYYMDTDSLFLHADDKDKVVLGKELGQFSDDLDGGKIIKAIFISKKMYYLEYVMPDGRVKVKMTGKGVEKGALSKADYEAMLREEVVNVCKPNQFIRDVKNGRVMVKVSSKNIKMNSGGRIFLEPNHSVPLGHQGMVFC